MERHDVFISYAHLDNESGWVSEFDKVFKRFLSTWLGRPADIWRDKTMGAGDYIWETIEKHLSSSLIFVSIISPSYLNSEWSRRELKAFIERNKHLTGNKSFVFNIRRVPVKKDQIPADIRDVLENVIYLEFFKEEETGRIRIFSPDRGEELRSGFLDHIDDLAQDVYQRLKDLQTDGPTQTEKIISKAPELQPFSGASVYLSVPSPDLLEEYLEIKKDFLNRGATILPANILQPRPPLMREYEKQITAEMLGSKLVVHFVGSEDDQYSADEPQSLVRRQADLASLFQAEAGFTRLILLPKDVRPNTERHRSFVEQLKETTSRKVDLLRTTLDLKTEMERILLDKPAVEKAAGRPAQPEAVAPPAESAQTEETAPAAAAVNAGTHPPPTVYILHERTDAEAVLELSKKLFQKGCEVWTVAADSGAAQADLIEEHRWYLTHCDAALVFWDQAKKFRVRALMSELVSILDNGRERAFTGSGVFIEGDSPEKDNFLTHERVIRSESELDELVAALKTGGSDE